VTSAAKKILEDAMALTDEAREELGMRLLESVPAVMAPDVETAWRDEVVRRIEELQRGDVRTESWGEVKERIRESLASE